MRQHLTWWATDESTCTPDAVRRTVPVMTKTGGSANPKQVARLGASSLLFGFGDLMIQLWMGGHPFQGKPTSWGLGEVLSLIGVVFLCWAALLRRQQR
jgi:hypothetical protein